MAGVDSAIGPTPAQAQAVKDAGYSWWAFYIGYQGVPGNWGCFHQWRLDEVKVLLDDGWELFLPIFFPHTIAPGGPISRMADPELDADLAVYATLQYGVQGVVALDTEYEMRQDPDWTMKYTNRWMARVINLHQWKAVVYAGGFTYKDHPFWTPGWSFPWWIIPGGKQAPSGTAWQTGQDTIAGLHVDTNSIGNGFPLATKIGA